MLFYNLYSRLPGAIQWALFGYAMQAAINGRMRWYMVAYDMADHMRLDHCHATFRALDYAAAHYMRGIK